MRAVKREEIEEEWFRKHKATYENIGNFETGKRHEKLSWKNPKKYTYSVFYLRAGDYLFVYGDLGNAVYRALDSLKSWAACDIIYFSQKCTASETGAQYREWDPDYLEEHLKGAIKESDKTWHNFCSRGGKNALYDEKSWIIWVAEYGMDFWDDLSTVPYGMRISVRCRAHLIGLKMALEQLE